MSKTTHAVVGKDEKVQIRLGASEKLLLTRAAKLRRTSLSAFLLENACTAAQEVLAAQSQFVVPQERWAAFCKALDAPPRSKPALKKLLRDASVFDGHPTA